MNTKMRGSILVLVLGLVILIVASQTPSVSQNENSFGGPAGSLPNQVYFFEPMNVAIAISQLQSSATLLVQPINYDNSSALGVPVVNASVVALDIVTFSIAARGYYVVSFLYGNGSIAAVSYLIRESGIPSDMTTLGFALSGIGAIMCLLIVLNSRKIIRLSRKRAKALSSKVETPRASSTAAYNSCERNIVTRNCDIRW